MSLNDLRDDAVLAGQLGHLDNMVRSIRPLVILGERNALRELLETFMSDGGDRAPVVAALAVIELAKLNPFWSAS